MAAEEEAVALFAPKAAKKRKHKHNKVSPQQGDEAGALSQPSSKKRTGPQAHGVQSAGEAAPPLPDRATGEASTSAPAPAILGPDDLPDADDFKSLGVSVWLCAVLQSLGISKPTQVSSSAARPRPSAPMAWRQAPLCQPCPCAPLPTPCTHTAGPVGLHPGHPFGAQRDWHGADGQRQDGGVCAAHAAALGS